MNLNPIVIIKAILRKIVLIALFPVIVVGVVAYQQLQKPREYQSGMMFYTGLVSGGSVASPEEGRVDHFAVSNAFDNLMTVIESREVIEEVAMRLLAEHLRLDEPDPLKISPANYEKVHRELLPQSLMDDLLAHVHPDSTLQHIRRLYAQSEPNEITRLIDASGTFYNVDVIRQGLIVSRKRNSDMIEVIYRSSDPGVCFLTLQILADTFIAKNQHLRQMEAGGIVRYFENELAKARAKLDRAEDTLKEYSQENQIINYSEQTKYLAAAREDLERDISFKRATVDAHQQAIARVEQKLGTAEKVYLNNRQIIEKRNTLSSVNSQIAKLQILGRPADGEELAVLREQAETLGKEVRALAEEHMALSYSTESLPRTNIINQWLTHVLELDKSRAELTVLHEQRDYFDSMFDFFAPIGFTLGKMEREINIAEREYLSVLHGLNMARIRESNFEVFNTLELLDEPFFPLNPRSTRARLLVIGAFLASLFFITGLVVVTELIDRSLRTPAKAESETGLDAIGATTGPIKNKKIDAAALHKSLFNLLVNKLVFYLHSLKTNAAPCILVFSTRKQEALPGASREIARAIRAIHQDVVFLRPGPTSDQQEEQVVADEEVTTTYYGSSEQDIREKTAQLAEGNTPAVIQLPDFEQQNISGFLKLQPHINILVVDASQTWDYHDRKLLESLRENYPDTLFKVMVCQVEPDRLDDFLAMVPRKRSFLRKWVKKLVKLNL